MKAIVSGLFLLAAVTAAGQPKYIDSLRQYQLQYKTDLSAIIQSDTSYVRFYAPNAAYRVFAKVELLNDQPFFNMRTSSGKARKARKYARVTFRLNNQTHQLLAYQLSSLLESGEHKDNFFIPFLDAGSGEETYGGGRYLDFKTGDIVSNSLLIDFNKAYNPYCAFASGYNCPIPPRENMLSANVPAGEKQYAKEKH